MVVNSKDPVLAGRVAARMARLLECELIGLGLTIQQYRLLIVLEGGSVPAGALTGDLAISRPSVTALVDKLCERGLVVRVPYPGDRRRVDQLLTPEGRAALNAADAAAERAFKSLRDLLDSEAQLRADEGLSVWSAALDVNRDNHRQKVSQSLRSSSLDEDLSRGAVGDVTSVE